MQRPVDAGPEQGDEAEDAEEPRARRGFEKRGGTRGGTASRNGHLPMGAARMGVRLMAERFSCGGVGHARCYNITRRQDKGRLSPAGARHFWPRGMDRAARLCYFPGTGQALRKRPETYSQIRTAWLQIISRAAPQKSRMVSCKFSFATTMSIRL